MFRRKRMRKMEILTGISPDWKILDLGGSPEIWRLVPTRPRITIVNLDPHTVEDTDGGRLEFVIGDATSLPYAAGSYDMVFSNSLIEHLHDWETQVRFAEEVRRLGKIYWVQTPARMSLIEPHTIGIIAHWLPRRIQPGFIRWLSAYGWTHRPSRTMLRAFADEVRLLSYKEMVALFPDALIITERFLFFPKSYIALYKSKPGAGSVTLKAGSPI